MNLYKIPPCKIVHVIKSFTVKADINNKTLDLFSGSDPV